MKKFPVCYFKYMMELAVKLKSDELRKHYGAGGIMSETGKHSRKSNQIASSVI